jgi:hypothetical protein
MTQSLNIYCDESCHLENDNSPIMVLGALVCNSEKINEIFKRIYEIKKKHNISAHQEVKWTKISPSNAALYGDLIDYFFDDDDLTFRGIVCHKSNLDHQKFNNSSHDEWYYKMYFLLLSKLFDDRSKYYIYIDIKDTNSQEKSQKLHQVLCNDKYDFKKQFIKRVQPVRSHEVQALQIADVLIGIISYANRGLNTSSTKLDLINRVKIRAQLSSLEKSNYSKKFNLFHWDLAK